MIEPADVDTLRERLRSLGDTFICGNCKKEKFARAGEFYIAKDATYCIKCVRGMKGKGGETKC